MGWAAGWLRAGVGPRLNSQSRINLRPVHILLATQCVYVKKRFLKIWVATFFWAWSRRLSTLFTRLFTLVQYTLHALHCRCLIVIGTGWKSPEIKIWKIFSGPCLHRNLSRSLSFVECTAHILIERHHFMWAHVKNIFRFGPMSTW